MEKNVMGKKVRICISLDEDIMKPMMKIKKETGLSISRQIELKLQGYEIKRKEVKK